jgi:hypothetical protein
MTVPGKSTWKPTALDCLRRGLASSGANWELVVVQWLHGFVLSVLFVVGAALPFLALGYDLAQAESPWDDLERTSDELVRRAQGRLLVLLAALLGMLLLWLLAVYLHAWVQAGTYGVLHAADRQAPPGEPGVRLFRDSAWRAYRTFAWRNFFGWAGLYGSRFFGFANLAGLFFVLWSVAVPLWATATLGGAARWGETGALGIGCGGALPLGFVLVVLLLWYAVAQADLAREGSGVWVASRSGFAVLGARLGTVILLFAAFLCPFVLLAVAGLAARAAGPLWSGRPALRAAAETGFTLVASLTQGLLLVALGGTLVALVRSETGRRRAGSPVAA